MIVKHSFASHWRRSKESGSGKSSERLTFHSHHLFSQSHHMKNIQSHNLATNGTTNSRKKMMNMPTNTTFTKSALMISNCDQQEEKMNRIPSYIMIPDLACFGRRTKKSPCSESQHAFSPSNARWSSNGSGSVSLPSLPKGRWSSNGAGSLSPPPMPNRGSANSLNLMLRKASSSRRSLSPKAA
jgi:hypothetical protein